MMVDNILYFFGGFTLLFSGWYIIMKILNKYVLLDHDIDWSAGKGQCKTFTGVEEDEGSECTS